MSARDLGELIGQSGLLETDEGLLFKVRIIDARRLFGRVDVLVEPGAGEGEAWVSARRIKLD